MCYRTSYLTHKARHYAEYYGSNQGKVEELEKQLEIFKKKLGRAMYHANGFDHPELPVISNDGTGEFQLLSWGLIPHNTKPGDVPRKQKQLLNTQSEDMFETWSYRWCARHQRCLVAVDGFFDFYYFKGKTFPHYIKLKDNSPMTFAGLWSNWG